MKICRLSALEQGLGALLSGIAVPKVERQRRRMLRLQEVSVFHVATGVHDCNGRLGIQTIAVLRRCHLSADGGQYGCHC